MRVPIWNKRRGSSGERRTPHEFLMQVLIPGFVVWYLVQTQPDYIALITQGETDLMTVEIIYLALHIIFTYVVLPATWLLDLVEFLMRGVRMSAWIRKVLYHSTHALFWFLLIAVILRVVALPWYA